MIMDSKVFVVMDDGRKDLSQALRWGDPVIMFKQSFYPDTTNERQGRVLKHALRTLKNFDDGSDSILLVGDSALIAITFAALVMLGMTKVRMLKYDRRARDYYPIEIDFTVTLGSI